MNNISFIKITPTLNFYGSHRKTEQGNTYYHTEWGKNIGITSTVLASAVPIVTAVTQPKIFKYSLLAPLIVAPSIFLGKIADKVTNIDNKDAVDSIKKYGVKRALSLDENIKVSKRGNAYKKTENGTALGSVATVAIVAPLLLYKIIKDRKVPKDIDVFLDAMIVPGGLLFGNLALSDFIANIDLKLNA